MQFLSDFSTYILFWLNLAERTKHFDVNLVEKIRFSSTVLLSGVH